MRITSPSTLLGTLGALAQAVLGPLNALVTSDRGFTYGASFASTANLAVTTNEQIVAPASNLAGITVWACSLSTRNSGISQIGLIAKSSAPASGTDGDVLLTLMTSDATAAGQDSFNVVLPRSVFVGAGKGLYFRNQGSAGETGAYRSIQYTVH